MELPAFDATVELSAVDSSAVAFGVVVVDSSGLGVFAVPSPTAAAGIS